MKKGFTLIELLAVIVILAIIALIATPIILGIINNATMQSKERTSELIGEAILNAYTSYSLKQPSVTIDNFCSYMEPSYFTMDNVEYVGCNDNEAKLKSGTDNYTVIFEAGKAIVTLDGSDVKKEVLINPNYVEPVVEPSPEDWFRYQTNQDGTITINAMSDNWDRNVKNIVFPETIDGKVVTDLGYTAFYGCDFNSIVIPNTVTRIVSYSFIWNAISSLDIPSNVKKIEQYAFRGNGLTSLTLHEGITYIDVGAFANNNLTSVIIPDSLTDYKTSAFDNYTSLYTKDGQFIGMGTFGN